MSFGNSIHARIVPWLNSSEFKKVYEYLYSDEINKKKWAYDTISVWETRCRPSLPTAIEATYVLTSAVIQDILWTNKASLVHHTDLQGIYGSAVTRFVSLSVEVNKNKDVPSYSIAEVAKSIGIPSFIVDIRNEWCHSGRPSLSVLRSAAESALDFLKKSYWEKEAARVTNYVRQPLDETKLHNLFKEFIKFHSDTVSLKKEKVIQFEDGRLEMNPEYCRLLRMLEKSLKKNKRLFVKVLVSDGIFIPSDEDFKGLVSKDEYRSFNIEYYMDDDEEEDDDEPMDEDMYMQMIEFETKNLPEIPDNHEDLWEQIIVLLNKYDAVPLFMESLLKSQGNRTVIGQKLLISWILKILRVHSATGFPSRAHHLRRLFKKKGIITNWFSMFHSAVVNPCKYTSIVLPLILNNLNLKKKIAHRIIGIMSVKLGFVNAKSLKGDFFKLFHTVEDLKESLEFQRWGADQQSAQNIWTSFPDDCYKSWPMGYIVNMIKEKDVEDYEVEFEDISAESADIVCRLRLSNKNEEDDDDQTCEINDEPDLNKIMSEIDKRDSLLYKKSG